MVVGKELEIRRWLSRSHLYSSAFVVTFEGGRVILHGAGWGHGVGLCQIGAAVMATKGLSAELKESTLRPLRLCGESLILDRHETDSTKPLVLGPSLYMAEGIPYTMA